MYKTGEIISTSSVIREAIAPVEVIHTPEGEMLLDFGQSINGWVQFVLWQPAGTCIRLTFGETPQTEGIGFQCIADGSTRLIDTPCLVCGFRYVKCEGFGDELDPVYFTACAV